jgi:hypothetical protein
MERWRTLHSSPMTKVSLATGAALVLIQLGCGGSDTDTGTQTAADMTASAGTAPVAQAGSAAPGACTIASSCVDIDVPPLSAPACCTPTRSCGYLLPELDAETLMWFPQTQDLIATLTPDDPNHRCAPESFYFGPQQGLNEERREEPGEPDVLIASTCNSYHIAAFTFAGCCMPDDTCGLSTHSYGRMFAEIVNDLEAPFAHPECVPAEVLNEQFRAHKLGSVARLMAGGSCNYAEIDARQPHVQ